MINFIIFSLSLSLKTHKNYTRENLLKLLNNTPRRRRGGAGRMIFFLIDHFFRIRRWQRHTFFQTISTSTSSPTPARSRDARFFSSLKISSKIFKLLIILVRFKLFLLLLLLLLLLRLIFPLVILALMMTLMILWLLLICLLISFIIP